MKMRTKSGWVIPKRDKYKTFIAPKNLHYSKIENLKNVPYFKEKAKEINILKPTRGFALNVPGKPEFFSKCKATTLFS